jgi:metallophosphoesterase (TIGR03767 family)
VATFDRRTFLRRLAGLSAAAWGGPLWASGAREAWARTAASVVRPEGTTLERSIVPTGPGPYFRLTHGPGWPIRVRTELAEPKRGRQERRVAVASLLHVTDFQFPDAQSPARVEFLDRYADEPTPSFVSAAHRPHEALVLHASEAVVRQANLVRAGPVTGRPLDCTVSTGDNFDNKQANELRWFLTLMDGGEVAANSGARDRFEGVQSFDDPAFYDPHYYHPEPVDDPRGPDNYKRFFGFPDYPGLLDAAIAPFVADGIGSPWYSVYGNHDALVQGNERANPGYEAIATGGTKVLHPPPGVAPGDFARAVLRGDPEALTKVSAAPARPVAPDPQRRFITAEEFVRGHLASPPTPGPAGHGFTEDNLDPVHLYYRFQLAPGVVGVTLDTTSPQLSEGSIGQAQLGWLEEQLVAVSSRHFDAGGNEVRTGNEDQLVVVFSHHRADSMEPVQGPDEQGDVERRFGGEEVEELLHRFPNVVAWVNGHSHVNRVAPRPDRGGRTAGYWDITTSAQVDPPQQARVVELVDNRDGTLSVFTTILDHAAPPETAVGDYDVFGLAAIARELSYNDYQADVADKIGAPTDLNTELLLPAPFRLTPEPARAAPGRRREPGAAGAGREPSATGPGGTVGIFRR